MKCNDIPIWEKQNLTIEEAARYSNIGQRKLRELTDNPLCPFVLFIGTGKRLIKRKKFDQFIETQIEI